MSDCNSQFIISNIIKNIAKKKIIYNKFYIINNFKYIIKKPKKK
jgi:hypothetical protein